MQDKLKEKIMKALQQEEHSVTSRGLMRKVGTRDKKGFYEALNELKQDGEVVVNQKHMVKNAASAGRVKASVVSLSKGFAFARPLAGGEDIFIHANDLKSAMVGDTVLLEHVKASARGMNASVDLVIEKKRRSTTGTMVRSKGVCEVIPDIAIRYNIPVEKGCTLGARDGDKVQTELYRHKHEDKLYARVTQIFGKASSARICADAIIAQNGIPTVFAPEVIEEATRISAQKITEADLKDRLDLRQLGIFTIDGEDAKDLDDAISVSRTKNGYKLGVHIADVSHYVTEGSAIDEEAQLRGTSVYFADRVIPMLPKELSNGVCSLNAGEDKLTFSAIIELDKSGEILSYQFKKSVIHSKVRGVYSEVNKILNKTADAELKKKYSPVIRSLNAAKELADIIKERSKRHGTMDLESSESRFTLNENGICVDVQPRTSGEAEELIEQLMVTANQAAAKLAKAADIPFVYRVHQNPDPNRVQTLTHLVEALGLNSRTIKKLNPRTADFAAILEQAIGTPAQKVISHQILRTMEKAKYSTEPIGHFGLALEDYCHFTSPIRRYPDTAIHRILSAFSSGKDKEYLRRHYADFAKLSAAQSSHFEVRAMMAERSAEDCYMAEFMSQHIGECYDGVISGVTQRGIFVELASSAEGFVPVDSFEGARYRFDGMITQVDELTGNKLTIGLPLRIKVVAADVATGRIDFIPAPQEEE
jgi:ribonuclease R